MKSSSLVSALSVIVLGMGVSSLCAAQSQSATPAPQKASADADAANETLVLSDTLDYDDNSKTSVFSGNVILTRGLMRLNADKLEVSEDKQGTKHGKATMNKGSDFIHILQEQPEKYTTIKGQGKVGLYEGEGEVFRLRDQAVVTRFVCGRAVDNVRGHEVIYNSDKGTYRAVADSKQAGQRVRSLVLPNDRIKQLTEECRRKYHNKPMPTTIQTQQ
ncbi:lipopolysaccharide transport periplasmic protein LptA [Brackiella oedipodis]|uniref:lipopolysaccharide transport periplasmic protein LptA n=1 Tax=Brackiella oedipodis TaxID=124225 RepID=UPI00048C3715|nr:lipopolysaccharide transport periplasmic protein LptA [Brackiella oedipodis]